MRSLWPVFGSLFLAMSLGNSIVDAAHPRSLFVLFLPRNPPNAALRLLALVCCAKHHFQVHILSILLNTLLCLRLLLMRRATANDLTKSVSPST